MTTDKEKTDLFIINTRLQARLAKEKARGDALQALVDELVADNAGLHDLIASQGNALLRATAVGYLPE